MRVIVTSQDRSTGEVHHVEADGGPYLPLRDGRLAIAPRGSHLLHIRLRTSDSPQQFEVAARS